MMESENSVVLESCGEDSMLIQAVKTIVTQSDRNDLGNEGFFLVTNVQDDQQRHTEVANQEPCVESQIEERILWSDLCRVCANVNDHLIPIFEGEGIEHELCNKIHKYLPIRVSETDTLPLQLCYHCAATLLAWHELTEGCLNAERRLLEIQESLHAKQQCVQPPSSEDRLQDTPQAAPIVVNSVESLPVVEPIELKDDGSGRSPINNPDRWQIEANSVVPTIAIQDTKAEEVHYVECAQCDTLFIDVKCFIHHMNVEHDTNAYYCPYCKAAYRGPTAVFQEHMLSHDATHETAEIAESEAEAPIKQECESEMDSGDASKRESTCDSLSLKKTYTCCTCEESFLKKHDLKKHINAHRSAKVIQSRDEAELVSKAKQMVNERISYSCEICKKSMFTKRGFLRHIRVHTGERPCKCDLCGKCYRIEQDLARHIRDVHEGLKKYACDICGRAFANKGAKDDHRRIHTGERPYTCEHCPKTFRTLNSIYIHNRVHTNYKPHKCSYCGKYFRSRQRLSNHETTHTGVKAYSCEICGKSFSVKGEVMRHRAIHSQEKPFNCRCCDLKFGQKRYLRNHIKQHHKEEASSLLAELNEKRN